MTITIVRDGVIPENVLRREAGLNERQWFHDEDLHCPTCGTVFRLDLRSDEVSGIDEYRRDEDGRLLRYRHPPGVWWRSLVSVGFRPGYNTRCPACHRKMIFAQHRVGPFWRRRWYTSDWGRD